MKKKFTKLLKDLKEILPDTGKNSECIEHLLNELNHAEVPEKVEAKKEFFLSDSNKKYDYILFSDGACRGNPGPGGWGVLGQEKTGVLLFEDCGYDHLTTNNRMELTGAIESLRTLKSLDGQNVEGKSILLISDSKYVIDGIQKWVPGWKRKGWKKSDGKAPENLELWQLFDEVVSSLGDLSFEWVKGHSGHPQNDRCDELANKAIDEIM